MCPPLSLLFGSIALVVDGDGLRSCRVFSLPPSRKRAERPGVVRAGEGPGSIWALVLTLPTVASLIS